MSKDDIIYGNTDFITQLASLPDNAVYVILGGGTGIAQVSIVKNAIMYHARQIDMMKRGVHQCGFDVDKIYWWSDFESLNPHILREAHRVKCEELIKDGYKVYGSERSAKSKIRYAIKQNKVFLQIVNSRKRVIMQTDFPKMAQAKAFASGKTMLQLMGDISNAARAEITER